MLILIILLQAAAFGQNRTDKPVPPPVRIAPPPSKREPVLIVEKEEQCFMYKAEQHKDSLVYVTETLLKYRWNSDRARIMLTTYTYDPVEKAKAEEAGYDLLSEEYVQFIDGRVKLEKNHLIFIPDKPEKFKSHTFTVIYQAETDQVKCLMDENNHILSTSDCPLPIVSM